MTRTRSQYLGEISGFTAGPFAGVRAVVDADRDALAELMLDAYRGSIDDEGEDLGDALDAIDDYLGRIVREHSIVHEDGTGLLGMCFVVEVRDRHYVDPIAVHPSLKGQGVGRALVATTLASLASAGVTVVGATITDGNVPSERLFAGLGFRRVGAWR